MRFSSICGNSLWFLSAFLLSALLLDPAEAGAHAVRRDHVPISDHAAQPQDVDGLIRRYSLTGDDHLLAVAWQQLQHHDEELSAAELLQAAWLAQAGHDFARARDLIARVLRRQPHNGQAWLLETATAAVMGDTGAARRACGRLVLSVSPLAALTCNARLARSVEDKVTAYKRLQAMPGGHRDPALQAWTWSTRAELARDLGRLEEAETLFRRAIEAYPAVQTRAALMDLLLGQARYADALLLCTSQERVPALMVRRLMALRGSGEDIGPLITVLDARFRDWLAAADYRHAREMAIFYLDIAENPAFAYRAAAENAKIQREAEDLVLLQRAAGGK